METKPSGFQHSAGRITLIVGAWLTYIAMVTFNALSVSGAIKGLFNSTMSEVAANYKTDLFAGEWNAYLWYISYAWNGLWLLYLTGTIFRKTTEGYVYIVSELFPWYFFAAWYLNNACNVAWLFIFDLELVQVGLPAIFLALMAFTLYLCLAASYRQVDKHGMWLSENLPFDLFLNRALVQNGLAFYATWATIATLVNLSIPLVYEGGFDEMYVCSALLAVLLVEVLVWFVLENFVLDRFCRYTLTTWVVVVVALSGIVEQNYCNMKRHMIYAAVLRGLSLILLLVRLFLVVYRRNKFPLSREFELETIEESNNGSVNGAFTMRELGPAAEY